MPISWTAIFRVVVLLLMAAHVFYLYAFARTLQEMVGLDPATVLAASSFALVMLVPLAWAVALPDLPIIIHHHRGRRRFEQGRCPECGYFVLHAAGVRCPDCGASRAGPPEFSFTWATVRRFVVLALAAWLIGCVAAESWAAIDEASFAREARASVAVAKTRHYSRPRRWPMDGQMLYYSGDDGVTASPDFMLQNELAADGPGLP